MFKGAITPAITVFDKQGKIDEAGNTQHINRLIDEGINGILFLGSIGEFFALTMDEKKEFIDLVLRVVDKRVPVLIGTGGTILAEVIELTNYAQQAGAAFADVADVLAVAGVAEGTVQLVMHGIGEPDHRIQGCPDVVVHLGDEVLPVAAGRAGRRLGAVRSAPCALRARAHRCSSGVRRPRPRHCRRRWCRCCRSRARACRDSTRPWSA